MSPLFTSGDQSIGASASASLLPLGLTGLISLLSKGLSRVFSSTTVQQHEFFGTQLSAFFDYAKAFDCVDHNKLWKTLNEMRIPDHLTCLLRNLSAGQEAMARTIHGKMDWF